MLENINPRKHVSASIGWAVFMVIALAAPICAWLVAKDTENFFRQAANDSLTQSATQIHQEIAAQLDNRVSVMQLAAAQIGHQLEHLTNDPAELRHALEAIHHQHPELNWLGVANKNGTVISAANGVLIGEDVSMLPWFIEGSDGAYLSDMYNAELLEQLLPVRKERFSFQVLDVAVPVTDANGDISSVLGGHLSWNWVRNLQALSLSSTGSNAPELELIIASEDNIVISGPEALLGQPLPDRAALSEQGRYLVGIDESASGNSIRLDWTLAVRQESAQAIAAGRAAQKIVILTVLAAATVAALLIVFAVSKLTRRLRLLSQQSIKIARGELKDLKPFTGKDDVSQISHVLATSLNDLHQQEDKLQALNTELDQRVEDRTREIERLSAESREVALTQQRLRFARDMHDTLAHSMMAVLTQVRLIRKIRKRLSEDEIDDELRRAETVALNGLTEARSAIAQVRTDNVKDRGLTVAIHELAERIGSRTGLSFHLEIDPHSIHQDDQRGETIYRIVEEAVRNIEKHANAREVQIILRRINSEDKENSQAPAFELEIIDDGQGFNPEQRAPGHYGLIGLREQAALIEGTLQIESSPANGTIIRLTYNAFIS